MNLELLKNFMRPKGLPGQKRSEWQMFLEICETYIEKQKIKKPIVVELGVKRNKQKRFWKQFFGAEHIGIDISNRKGEPDILGDLHDPETLRVLKKKLRGRPISILFIDADHSYEAVKRDFEIYSPLCDGIVAFHDIEAFRYSVLPKGKKTEVWKFWDELKRKAHEGIAEYKDFLFLSISQYEKHGQLGIGVIIKK